jgi:hypothetical protein
MTFVTSVECGELGTPSPPKASYSFLLDST